jgi:hypothetical protein
MRLIVWIFTGVSSRGAGGVLGGICSVLFFFQQTEGTIGAALHFGFYGGIAGIISGIFIGIVVGEIINSIHVREIIGGSIIGLLSGAFGAGFSGFLLVGIVSINGSDEAFKRAMFVSSIWTIVGAIIGLTVGCISARRLSRKPNDIA